MSLLAHISDVSHRIVGGCMTACCIAYFCTKPQQHIAITLQDGTLPHDIRQAAAHIITPSITAHVSALQIHEALHRNVQRATSLTIRRRSLWHTAATIALHRPALVVNNDTVATPAGTLVSAREFSEAELASVPHVTAATLTTLPARIIVKIIAACQRIPQAVKDAHRITVHDHTSIVHTPHAAHDRYRIITAHDTSWNRIEQPLKRLIQHVQNVRLPRQHSHWNIDTRTHPYLIVTAAAKEPTP